MTPDRVAFASIATQNCGLAAWDADSPIVTTAFDYREMGVTLVRAADPRRKTMLWHRRVLGRPYPPRLTKAGTLWLANCSPKGVVMMELNAEGTRVDSIKLESDPLEELGAYVVLPDGIVALWIPTTPGRVLPQTRRDRLARFLPTRRGRSMPRHRHARVARHDKDGTTRWSTSLPLTDISSPGAVHTGQSTEGEYRPMPPWTSRTLEAGRDPLLVSRSRIAATVACASSGVAVTFFVALATGQRLGETAPGPSHLKAIAGPGEFLLGCQGYGEFRTAHHDATGAVIGKWPTHAQMLIDADGAISGPESENIVPSRSHFVRFGSDGTVQRGPALSAYRTTYPALDRGGTAVFWRDGALRAVDADMNMRELFVTGHGNATPSRVLLLGDGYVVFALNDQLVVHHEPGLEPLNDGVWPCGEGGLRGNPVAFLQDS
ncbi:hypothetical protein [Mycobacterium sp. 236(2023)]|uniref:hypothetical protein n=1 Tax=Mycobacterium sp. 236(2023) TaxID=3038163 RepID=UPI002414FA07|nr:hypothetical protein [Mycobacterium sp. 236(2023)]MDG4666681.1 hypothetical protein [Mycobacterium sp. 236(2023)]